MDKRNVGGFRTTDLGRYLVRAGRGDGVPAVGTRRRCGGQDEAQATPSQGRAFLNTLATWGLWLILSLRYLSLLVQGIFAHRPCDPVRGDYRCGANPRPARTVCPAWTIVQPPPLDQGLGGVVGAALAGVVVGRGKSNCWWAIVDTEVLPTDKASNIKRTFMIDTRSCDDIKVVPGHAQPPSVLAFRVPSLH